MAQAAACGQRNEGIGTVMPGAPVFDPFNEFQPRRHVLELAVLGGHFRFESDSPALLALAEAAFGGLPPLLLPDAQRFVVALDLVRRQPPHRAEPPAVRTHAGAGVLCGIADACNHVLVAPASRRAAVVASEDMLERHPYHLRYELVEFAAFVLAARGMGLAPLHGACVGRDGRGVLLLGASGAGKSTLALLALRHGLEFLAEDALFVDPVRLLATGAANYLHLRRDVLACVDVDTANWIAAAPLIRRRSGVEKFEVDLRRGGGRPAQVPLRLCAGVFVSPERAVMGRPLLQPLAPAEAAALLAADQPYAAAQPGWSGFVQGMQRIGVHRLRRGTGPQAGLDALLQLLAA